MKKPCNPGNNCGRYNCTNHWYPPRRGFQKILLFRNLFHDDYYFCRSHRNLWNILIKRQTSNVGCNYRSQGEFVGIQLLGEKKKKKLYDRKHIFKKCLSDNYFQEGFGNELSDKLDDNPLTTSHSVYHTVNVNGFFIGFFCEWNYIASSSTRLNCWLSF